MAKRKIAILTDSTAYLPDDYLRAYDIHVIPLIVNWGGTSYLDNVDISPEEFYTRLQIESELPTTSQPSAGQFKDLFSELAKEYEDGVVAILISSELSGTVASAQAAAKMMDGYPVEVVDSKVTTAALGLCAIEAAKAANAGQDIKAVAEVARNVGQAQKVMFIVDTLEFLHKGGRIGGAQRLLGSVLAIKPLLQLKDGKIQPLESVRTKKKAIHTMLGIFEEDMRGKEKVHVTVFHGVAEEDAKLIGDLVTEILKPEMLILAKLSPVIGVHTGPGTVGISYFAE